MKFKHDSGEAVGYIDKEFFDSEGMHKPPGWYFLDEEGDTYGPFLSEEHATNGLKLYLKQLMSGQSPTQLRMKH